MMSSQRSVLFECSVYGCLQSHRVLMDRLEALCTPVGPIHVYERVYQSADGMRSDFLIFSIR
jgi:hypothetical protein